MTGDRDDPDVVAWAHARAGFELADDDTRRWILRVAFGRFNSGRHGLRGDRMLPMRRARTPAEIPRQRRPAPALYDLDAAEDAAYERRRLANRRPREGGKFVAKPKGPA